MADSLVVLSLEVICFVSVVGVDAVGGSGVNVIIFVNAVLVILTNRPLCCYLRVFVFLSGVSIYPPDFTRQPHSSLWSTSFSIPRTHTDSLARKIY